MVGTVAEGVSVCARTSRLCSNCGDGSVKLVSTNLATTSRKGEGKLTPSILQLVAGLQVCIRAGIWRAVKAHLSHTVAVRESP